MRMRKDPLVNGQIYHICTKSIAGYKVFREPSDYERMQEMLSYYRAESPPVRFSIYKSQITKTGESAPKLKPDVAEGALVDILAYCLMPTHIHLILCQLVDQGISTYMKNLLNSYSRYFNTKYSRKGPLWQGRFMSVLVESDEQLIHLTRYVHLNPTSDNVVERPEDWPFSSYLEYLGEANDQRTTVFEKYLRINPESYRRFVDSRVEYQKQLAAIKHLCLE